MSKRSWSDDEVVEYDALVTEALKESAVADRIDVFLAGLDDAEQAQRYWAVDVGTGIRRRGVDKLLKSEQEQRRPRVPVTYEGRLIGRAPREMSRTVRDDDGHVEHHRAFFDYLTWGEIRDRIVEYARNRQALDVDIVALRKLLTLNEMVPDAITPAEACERLGTTVEEFLASNS